ncbi:CheD [Methylocella silvestris BL2]|uniref:Probable chemoreceptor glutamine deamidase CheD n=1 Tax=Methylocella silvestris (strain DSM 15510 / CIP 108128 / LMG 27833 / NCIMB 13906 / BL2) TaxID=395965 RepID=B8ESS0_METSB|nr:chemotaxis protein CheD [Methylocella silvestris]ACK50405.1 CheD [Methylocella silvestris BL2]
MTVAARRSEAGAAERRIHLIQGDYYVSDEPDVMLTTLLGSCVAACLYDRLVGVGGMNHFLLPGLQAAGEAPQAQRRADDPYAVHLMELLVNGLLRRGARRDRLEAKLFGGARTMEGLADVGARNSSFAKRFLEHEGIRVVGASFGGDKGRRIQFWPVSGRARQVFLAASEATPPPFVAPRRLPDEGAVEFF